jgi:hypothetical protein
LLKENQTMANTITNFYPTLFSDIAYMELAKAAVSPSVTNMTWVSPGGAAEAIRIPRFNYDESFIAAVTGLADNPSDVSEASMVLNLDRHKGFFYQIKYIEEEKSNVGLGEAVLRQRSAALASVVDADVLALTAGFTQILSGQCNKATLVSAIELLNEANAPQTDRVLVVNPDSYSDLLNTDDFIRADGVGDGTSMKTGQIGQVLGLDVFLSNNLPADTDASVMHRSAIAMAILTPVQVRVFDQPRHFAVGYSGRVAWGRVEIEDTVGVQIDRP